MPTRTVSFALLLTACLAWSACDEKLSSLAGPTASLTPAFTSIQQDIFESGDKSGRTACTQCHISGNPLSGGLNLTRDVAYAQLVNARSRFRTGAILVIPGDSGNSYLIQKLKGAPGIFGLRMPRNGPPYLTDGQLLIIERWIALGAPPN
jgi:hypothetical protein